MSKNSNPLDVFLATVEGRAFFMARLGTRCDADALDVVQDAMIRFANYYSKKPAEEWKPLFYRVLQSKIIDWHRREFVRSRILVFLNPGASSNNNHGHESSCQLPDPDGASAEDCAARNIFMKKLRTSLTDLPLRQRQSFLLRAWEGLSVAETALAMGCSEGSVKTHYSRALATLKTHLEGHGS
ncbi:MAG: RNA polymerase sigma factor [Deltaproteobacteria bacterium HGW-Deltaproteobacteria-18]|jgi:RNA polymerase sigma-70 factor (ECF subfamily)|nr:MAG: RNA polymerase sigma factor [Deltaproteobacteria bacterium HGW-Deltaproteobacteria-18]